MALRIEDYGILGDCHTVALVGNNGSIDWLCLPKFDSPACFAKLLGDDNNGYWKIAPKDEVISVRRWYHDSTLVLTTEFTTRSGKVRVTDFMPPRSGVPDLVRIVEAVEGEVPMTMELVIRFDYGHITPWVQRTDYGLQATGGPDAVYLHTGVELEGHDFRTEAHFVAKPGRREPFCMIWTRSHHEEPAAFDPEEQLKDVLSWWEEWASHCCYSGDYCEPVMRSLVTLKGLTYAPTGGVCAAPTTSLPEEIGGGRNWDYRYCWLRDATFTLFAFLKCGYREEARAWREWLIRAVAGRPDEIQIMYGLSGERRLIETELDWLSGYENSLPVRIGNGAHDQHQLDVYGELMDALQLARSMGIEPDENAWHIQRKLVDRMSDIWTEPDEGIWEIRGPRQHFTHSKVMAWVAADRAVKAVESFGLSGDADCWRKLRDDIKRDVLANGFDDSLNSFTQTYGKDHLDASLLMLPMVGFIDARDPKMVGTVKAIRERLSQDGFVKRYDCGTAVDGLEGSEGTFLICSFWLVDNLAMQGETTAARDLFEKLLDIRNDLGLLAEEYDPVNGRMLGNFPQAFSHLGLISSALQLDERDDVSPSRSRYECKSS